MPTEQELKRNAVKLLRRYDKLRKELLTLEHEARSAAAAYGKSIGVSGYRIDHLRWQVEQNKRTAA